MRAVRSELRRPTNRRASTQSMGRAYRDLFFQTRLPQIYWKSLMDPTVCKIANSDVDGGNSGICTDWMEKLNRSKLLKPRYSY
jgi:hypothetical protein